MGRVVRPAQSATRVVPHRPAQHAVWRPSAIVCPMPSLATYHAEGRSVWTLIPWALVSIAVAPVAPQGPKFKAVRYPYDQVFFFHRSSTVAFLYPPTTFKGPNTLMFGPFVFALRLTASLTSSVVVSSSRSNTSMYATSFVMAARSSQIIYPILSLRVTRSWEACKPRPSWKTTFPFMDFFIFWIVSSREKRSAWGLWHPTTAFDIVSPTFTTREWGLRETTHLSLSRLN